ncbi:hypothetical protein J1605_021178 [Eschrichtius robustus]|uniref:RAD52 motif-containing protein 1 n=1 Tax=Eschrichtius robustus TaxID=9764 RepID=A0AB34HIC3_ESCRO|nr:hypothetical protein J1605_021178 [Eschrichtius robustus]
MVALVPFVVPIVGDKTLLVWELSSGPTAEALQVSRAGAEGGVEEATSRLSNWAPRGTASAPHLPVHGTTLQHSLFPVFSQFGLYSVRVFPNAAVVGPVFYAIIKVYSARDAHRAQKACDQKQLFQTSPVKVGPNVEFLALLG